MGNILSIMTKYMGVWSRLHRFAHAIQPLYFSSMSTAQELNTVNIALAETTSGNSRNLLCLRQKSGMRSFTAREGTIVILFTKITWWHGNTDSGFSQFKLSYLLLISRILVSKLCPVLTSFNHGWLVEYLSRPRSRLDTKMLSSQYGNSHYKDRVVF